MAHSTAGIGPSTEHEQSLGGLVATATKDLSALIRMEKALALAEMKEKGKSIAPMAAGGIILAICGLPALLMFSAFGALAIGRAVGNMWGFLCMFGFWLFVMGFGGLIAMAGVRRLQRSGGPKPERTIRSIKDTADWARHPTMSPDVVHDPITPGH